jgi:hypothetical protein
MSFSLQIKIEMFVAAWRAWSVSLETPVRPIFSPLPQLDPIAKVVKTGMP